MAGRAGLSPRIRIRCAGLTGAGYSEYPQPDPPRANPRNGVTVAAPVATGTYTPEMIKRMSAAEYAAHRAALRAQYGQRYRGLNKPK